jgi:hypothetical protein
MIDNFILIRYKREVFDNMPKHVKDNFSSMCMDEWDKVQELLFQQQIEQIKNMYPLATIHLITNDKNRKDDRLQIHCFSDMESNHVSKLKVFGLLSESAMYVDNDIIFFKPFGKLHLETDHEFNLYQKSRKYDVQSLAKEKLPVPIDCHYNAGIIWVKKPSKELYERLCEIHERYFSDRELIMSQNRWADSDELPISVYISENKMKMKTFTDVSVQRASISKLDVVKKQSVHYTGIDINFKKLCLREIKFKSKFKFI